VPVVHMHTEAVAGRGEMQMDVSCSWSFGRPGIGSYTITSGNFFLRVTVNRRGVELVCLVPIRVGFERTTMQRTRAMMSGARPFHR